MQVYIRTEWLQSEAPLFSTQNYTPNPQPISSLQLASLVHNGNLERDPLFFNITDTVNASSMHAHYERANYTCGMVVEPSPYIFPRTALLTMERKESKLMYRSVYYDVIIQEAGYMQYRDNSSFSGC